LIYLRERERKRGIEKRERERETDRERETEREREKEIFRSSSFSHYHVPPAAAPEYLALVAKC
jgi:hypothetical protein